MYGDFHGSPALRAAVGRVLAQNVLRVGGDQMGGGEVHSDEVVVTGGATAALEAVAVALCDDGDALIVPAPYYPAFHIDLGMRAGVTVVPTAPATEVTHDALEEAMCTAQKSGLRVRGVLWTSPCNPSGRLHSMDEVSAVIAFTSTHSLHLIWDAVYAGTAYDEAYAATVTPRPHAGRRVHTVWSLSKDFGLSGWRVGCVHTADTKVAAALQNQMRFSGAGRTAQAATLALLGDAQRARRCLRRGAGALAERASIGRATLVTNGVPLAAVPQSMPDAGPLDLVNFGSAGEGGHIILDEGCLWDEALQRGVRAVRGEACGSPTSSGAKLRICWGATASCEEAREGAARLAEAYSHAVRDARST
jgi:aspartate/methionine/tyrosine aminotransferase